MALWAKKAKKKLKFWPKTVTLLKPPFPPSVLTREEEPQGGGRKAGHLERRGGAELPTHQQLLVLGHRVVQHGRLHRRGVQQRDRGGRVGPGQWGAPTASLCRALSIDVCQRWPPLANAPGFRENQVEQKSDVRMSSNPAVLKTFRPHHTPSSLIWVESRSIKNSEMPEFGPSRQPPNLRTGVCSYAMLP